jgi:hypothetical protein
MNTKRISIKNISFFKQHNIVTMKTRQTVTIFIVCEVILGN